MTSASELCLSVDLGTGGPKVGLVTLDGEVLASEVHHVVTHFGDGGEATQDAEEWWTIITGAAKRLLGALEGSRSRVRAVAVTGLFASTVPVDAQGRPTGPCLTWLDTRGRRYAKSAIGGHLQGYNTTKALRFIRKTGGAPSPSGADPVGQMLYLHHDHAALVAATRWMMEPVDYLTMRFSGVATATHASRLAMWMTDNRDLARYDYDPSLLAMVGLDATLLPPLVPFGSIVGPLSESVAIDLGLARDVAVVTGVPDLHAAALGSGSTGLFDTHLAISTTSWISCPVPKKKTDIAHSIASVPGLTNDSYVIIDNQETGAKALEWLQGVLAGDGAAMSFDDMTALAATSPPGANGVAFTPWLAGERSPVGNKNIRAGFSRLAVTTTTADLIRSVLEGVAANSAWLFTYVEKFAGRELAPLRLLGGGAQSSLWCQIYANTLGREVEQVDQPLLAQLRGTALLAAVALGRRRLDEITAPRPGVRFLPDATVATLYRARVEELRSLYQRDKKWMRTHAGGGST